MTPEEKLAKLKQEIRDELKKDIADEAKLEAAVNAAAEKALASLITEPAAPATPPAAKGGDGNGDDGDDSGGGEGDDGGDDAGDGDDAKGLSAADIDKMIGTAVSRAMQRVTPVRRSGVPFPHAGHSMVPVAPAISRFGVGDHEFSLRRVVRFMAYGRNESELQPVERAAWALQQASKGLNTGTDTEGGFLVPIEQATELIELVRAQAIVASSGASERPMSSGTTTVPKQTGGATAFYTAEGAAITESQESFGQMVLTAKKLAALVRVTSELIEDSDPSVEQIIRDDLVRVSALREDLAFLLGDGTGNTPIGMLNISGNQQYTPAADTGDGYVPTYQDLVNMQSLLWQVNATEGHWYFNPRFIGTLRKIFDSEGRPLWPADVIGGLPATILGWAYSFTTQIPTNVTKGTSTDTSYLFAAVPRELVIGRRTEFVISASEHRSFETDEVLVKSRSRHDFNARTPNQIVYSDGIRDN